MKWWSFLVLVLHLAAPTSAEAAGPLDDARSEVHSSSSSSDSNSSSSSSSSSSDDDDDYDDACSFGCGTGGGDLDLSGMVGWRYLAHPYADGQVGYIRSVYQPDEAIRIRRWSVRAHGEGSYQYAGLWRTGFGARTTVLALVGTTRWSWYRDTRENDSLWIGDAGLGVAVLRTPRVMGTVYGNALFFVDSQPENPGRSGNAYGGSGGAGFDLFLFDPMVLSFEAHVGKLGEAMTYRGRASLGVQMGPIEIFGGYDHLQLGGAPLGGPILGFRLWL